MLLIGTEVGQKIRIGNMLELLVTDIDLQEKVFSFRTQTRKGKIQKTIKNQPVGQRFQVQSNVALIGTRINVGQTTTVTLGFEAPRAIVIKGEWYTKQKKERNLELMSIPQLIELTEKSNATALEKHLGVIVKEIATQAALIMASNQLHEDWEQTLRRALRNQNDEGTL